MPKAKNASKGSLSTIMLRLGKLSLALVFFAPLTACDDEPVTDGEEWEEQYWDEPGYGDGFAVRGASCEFDDDCGKGFICYDGIQCSEELTD